VLPRFFSYHHLTTLPVHSARKISVLRGCKAPALDCVLRFQYAPAPAERVSFRSKRIGALDSRSGRISCGKPHMLEFRHVLEALSDGCGINDLSSMISVRRMLLSAGMTLCVVAIDGAYIAIRKIASDCRANVKAARYLLPIMR